MTWYLVKHSWSFTFYNDWACAFERTKAINLMLNNNNNNNNNNN